MYVELRTRSAFSFLQGASLPEDLVQRAAELGYAAIAQGDKDGVYSAPRFHQAAKAAGVRAIVAAELTLDAAGLSVPGTAPPQPRDLSPLFLLVANRTGYRNLCQLITQTKLRTERKAACVVSWEDLQRHSDGLIALSSLRNGEPAATALTDPAAYLARLQSLFPERLYLEVQRHLDASEERHNRTLIDLAQQARLPLVATNDVRHAHSAGRRLLDVLTCIHRKTSLDSAGRLLLNNAERHLKSPRDMAALFRDLPAAVANTERIAEQCEFTLSDLGYRFPEYPLPTGETPASYLRALTYAGASDRYGSISEKVRRQLEHELRIIGKLQLEGYFLIVWDIVRFCREQRILAQGRGSAANSAVCYALGITAVDAVGMDLLFERFLSEERGEWPDIDIDLPSGPQREKVIQYVYQRYGERGAAMTANVITYRARSAIREVGKALGFSLEQVDRLSKLLRRFEFRDGSDDLLQQLQEGGVDAQAPRVQQLVEMVGQIQNLPRHLGQHSGGMVIASGRLDSVVPLEPASMTGRVVVQWDKEDCADLGIIKVDLLGLGMMAVLEETIPLIRTHEGIDIDLARLPADDAKTYSMLQRADTIGVFQVESRAQMATLPRLRPQHFYDLVVEVALIRPGPVVGQMVHPYLNRRNGREPVTYAHPDLEPILRRTLGVPIFQEQLLRMAMAVSGFSGGEAEELRRAMGFKRSTERMQQIEQRLRAGMAQRGILGRAQDDIVRSITSFALYGFPESHAASFALIAYASAYLRAHHLAAFTCAMLNNWPLGFYHPATLVKDAQRHGLRVLPIDVTRSDYACSLETEASTPCENAGQPLSLRLGLKYVSGLRQGAGERIEAERRQSGFASIDEVIHRARLRDDEAQALAHLGAFAAFGVTRREALWQVSGVAREPLLRNVTGSPPKETVGRVERSDVTPVEAGVQGQMERENATARAPGFRREDEQTEPRVRSKWTVSTDEGRSASLPGMSLLERSLADYGGSGLTVGPQVIGHLREELRKQKVLSAAQIAQARDGQWVKLAGLVIVRQRPGTAKGMCFLTLEDETGIANAAVVPQVFQQYRALLHNAPMLLVEGPLQRVVASRPVAGAGASTDAQVATPVIHVLARRISELNLPNQPITQRGAGYRMRTTPSRRPTGHR